MSDWNGFIVSNHFNADSIIHLNAAGQLFSGLNVIKKLGLLEEIAAAGLLKASPSVLGNGFLVKSNTLSLIPTLSPGDNYYWSSNGVAYVICRSPSGVLTTNKIAP